MVSIMSKSVKSFAIIAIIFLAPLAGCFGENEKESQEAGDVLLIDFAPAGDFPLRSGEWHTFTLEGEGTRLVVPEDVLLFVNNSVVPLGVIQVPDDSLLSGKILTTPYVTSTTFTLVYADGTGTTVDLEVENGTPIVSGQDWFEHMEFILSVCADSTKCGGYVDRWMGTPNPAMERAASYFHGNFEGLGYDTSILRVTDHLNPTQPESLNIIAWKPGRSGDCV